MMQKRSVSSIGVLAVALTAFLMSAPVAAQALDSGVCGDFHNNYGPYDYRTNADKHAIVENFHFNSDVENLRKGMTVTYPGGDISYVLRAFPNHPRALDAISRLGVKEKAAKPRGSTYSVDCWFERAMRFRSDDGVVRMLYGIHLLRVGQSNEAIKRLEEARKINPADANILYNLGLGYVQVKNYERALESAHAAYALGFPMQGLKNQLKRAGKWREPSSVGTETE